MSKRTKVTAPRCIECGAEAVLATGREAYPHRPDLAGKIMWKCQMCPDSHCGCHEGTQRALGRPAGPKVREARTLLHKRMLDPLWQTADQIYEGGFESELAHTIVRGKARIRVYAFMASRLAMTKEECHTGLFDLDQCRAAWRALQGVSYAEIREWAKVREKAAKENGDT